VPKVIIGLMGMGMGNWEMSKLLQLRLKCVPMMIMTMMKEMLQRKRPGSGGNSERQLKGGYNNL